MAEPELKRKDTRKLRAVSVDETCSHVGRQSRSDIGFHESRVGAIGFRNPVTTSHPQKPRKCLKKLGHFTPLAHFCATDTRPGRITYDESTAPPGAAAGEPRIHSWATKQNQLSSGRAAMTRGAKFGIARPGRPRWRARRTAELEHRPGSPVREERLVGATLEIPGTNQKDRGARCSPGISARIPVRTGPSNLQIPQTFGTSGRLNDRFRQIREVVSA